ncbi:DNA-binding response OmpR family regulator [Azospirillum fermentarium]|uniref:response regulator n=1 Tax=Azospirillum fermentarium TaxID=1233114 RepID=UPI002227B86F|nr:response regulator [Azospirillum fermentarium]MCW2245841.1 DNA-binding response OmpR family regulator [Azospirillum fermentarium]
MASLDSTLAGARILLVEDDHLVGLSIASTLEAFGCAVFGPAYDAEAGVALALAEPLDAALLDVNLGGHATSETVADALRTRGVPFVFCTGYGDAGIPSGHAGAPTLQKPFGMNDLIVALGGLLAQRRNA